MTQNAKILKVLSSGQRMSEKKAQSLAIRNLRARVCELRGLGHPIVTQQRGGKAVYALQA